MSLHIIKFLLIVISLFAIKAQDPKMEEQSKAFTCMVLIRKMIEKNQGLGQEEIMRSMVKCFDSVTIDVIQEVGQALQTGREPDMSNRKYKNLVDGSDLIDKYSMDEIQKKAEKVNKILMDLHNMQEQAMKGKGPQGNRPGQGMDGMGQNNEEPGLMFRAIAGIVKILIYDKYLSYGLGFILLFILLRSMRMFCEKNKKKEKENVKAE